MLMRASINPVVVANDNALLSVGEQVHRRNSDSGFMLTIRALQPKPDVQCPRSDIGQQGWETEINTPRRQNGTFIVQGIVIGLLSSIIQVNSSRDKLVVITLYAQVSVSRR